MTKLYSGTAEVSTNPAVAFGPENKIFVYFGTGAYLEETDMMTTTAQKFICVIDKHDGATTTLASLKNQTTSITALGAAPGWYVNLVQKSGERVTEAAAVVAETVIFTSFAPDQDACVAGGESYLYQMSYKDGDKTSEQGSLNDRITSLGDGIASYPVIDLANGTAVVQSSDASIKITPIASLFQRMNVRSWQESFDHVQAVPDVQ
jgi:Tfp pilus tip-associated adhesin PilY1